MANRKLEVCKCKNHGTWYEVNLGGPGMLSVKIEATTEAEARNAANAYLAAPELVEALREIDKASRQSPPVGVKAWAKHETRWKAAIDAARALLAKVEGKA